METVCVFADDVSLEEVKMIKGILLAAGVLTEGSRLSKRTRIAVDLAYEILLALGSRNILKLNAEVSDGLPKGEHRNFTRVADILGMRCIEHKDYKSEGSSKLILDRYKV